MGDELKNPILDAMVRDFTQAIPRAKSEVHIRIEDYAATIASIALVAYAAKLRAVVDAWPLDVGTDAEYTDAEMTEILSNLAKRMRSDVEKLL